MREEMKIVNTDKNIKKWDNVVVADVNFTIKAKQDMLSINNFMTGKFLTYASKV